MTRCAVTRAAPALRLTVLLRDFTGKGLPGHTACLRRACPLVSPSSYGSRASDLASIVRDLAAAFSIAIYPLFPPFKFETLATSVGGQALQRESALSPQPASRGTLRLARKAQQRLSDDVLAVRRAAQPNDAPDRGASAGRPERE